MRTDEELRTRVREMVKADLKRRLDEASIKLPHLCTHNYRHALDSRKTLAGDPNENYNRIGDVKHLPLAQTMGLCMLGVEDPEQWMGTICDEPIDAQRCPYFDPKKNDQAITTEFWTQVKDPAWVEENLPAVAALLWVAGDPTPPPEPVKEPEPEPPPPPPPEPEVEVEDEEAPLAVVVSPPWWVRLWRRLFGGT